MYDGKAPLRVGRADLIARTYAGRDTRRSLTFAREGRIKMGGLRTSEERGDVKSAC